MGKPQMPQKAPPDKAGLLARLDKALRGEADPALLQRLDRILAALAAESDRGAASEWEMVTALTSPPDPNNRGVVFSLPGVPGQRHELRDCQVCIQDDSLNYTYLRVYSSLDVPSLPTVNPERSKFLRYTESRPSQELRHPEWLTDFASVNNSDFSVSGDKLEVAPSDYMEVTAVRVVNGGATAWGAGTVAVASLNGNTVRVASHVGALAANAQSATLQIGSSLCLAPGDDIKIVVGAAAGAGTVADISIHYKLRISDGIRTFVDTKPLGFLGNPIVFGENEPLLVQVYNGSVSNFDIVIRGRTIPV